MFLLEKTIWHTSKLAFFIFLAFLAVLPFIIGVINGYDSRTELHKGVFRNLLPNIFVAISIYSLIHHLQKINTNDKLGTISYKSCSVIYKFVVPITLQFAFIPKRYSCL